MRGAKGTALDFGHHSVANSVHFHMCFITVDGVVTCSNQHKAPNIEVELKTMRNNSVKCTVDILSGVCSYETEGVDVGGGIRQNDRRGGGGKELIL